ncbi:predicted protein [Histoplasma capsulatum var. duboisii H88]|uniref:Predicted protein n=1 Tax=Ajellomyces capsulatus (strain H88) TaxID=544711 RepID=F0UNW4_AJEC8|nr:predicted protein [Histoplasma capsulatum var. duboisii H88]
MEFSGRLWDLRQCWLGRELSVSLASTQKLPRWSLESLEAVEAVPTAAAVDDGKGEVGHTDAKTCFGCWALSQGLPASNLSTIKRQDDARNYCYLAVSDPLMWAASQPSAQEIQGEQGLQRHWAQWIAGAGSDTVLQVSID